MLTHIHDTLGKLSSSSMIYVLVPHSKHVRHLTDVIVDAIEEKGLCHEAHVCKSFNDHDALIVRFGMRMLDLRETVWI